MPGGLGLAGYIGLGRESSGGVAVSPISFLQALSEGLSAEFDRYELYNVFGRLAEPDDRAGIARVAGDIVAAFDPMVCGHFLKGAIGSPTVTVVASGALWKHVWKTPQQSQWDDRYALPPYTLDIFRDVGSAQQYAGCQVNRLELSLAPNQALQMTAGIIATSWLNKAAATASYSGAVPFTFDTASIAIAGAASAVIEAFTWTLDNGLEGIPTLANKSTVHKIKRTNYVQSAFSMTMGFEDITELNNFVNQTEQSLNVFLFPAASSLQLQLILPRVVYKSFPTGMGGRGRQTVEIAGQARYHNGSGTAFELGLTTTVGSY